MSNDWMTDWWWMTIISLLAASYSVFYALSDYFIHFVFACVQCVIYSYRHVVRLIPFNRIVAPLREKSEHLQPEILFHQIIFPLLFYILNIRWNSKLINVFMVTFITKKRNLFFAIRKLDEQLNWIRESDSWPSFPKKNRKSILFCWLWIGCFILLVASFAIERTNIHTFAQMNSCSTNHFEWLVSYSVSEWWNFCSMFQTNWINFHRFDIYANANSSVRMFMWKLQNFVHIFMYRTCGKLVWLCSDFGYDLDYVVVLSDKRQLTCHWNPKKVRGLRLECKC